jgi:hypothetical protein
VPGGIHYVSPNKDSRGNDLPKRTYKGEHTSLPVLRSEVYLLDSVYLLYGHKRTNADAEGAARSCVMSSIPRDRP